jgi:hypothetical protein
MREYRYRRMQSAFLAIMLTLSAMGLVTRWMHGQDVLNVVVAGVLLLGAAKAAYDAISDEPALKFDNRTISIRKFFGGVEEIPWRNVLNIGSKVVRTHYAKTTILTVTCEGGLFGARRLRVSTTALGMSPTQTDKLVADLEEARRAAVGTTGVAMAGASSRGWGVELGAGQSGFDPDAALARYLSSKEKHDTGDPAPQSAFPRATQPRTFGRRVS